MFSKYGGVNKKAKTESKVPISSHHEIVDFLSNVKAFFDSKPAVMALMKEFSDAYVPSSINEDLPPVLSTYFDKELSAAEYDTVMSVCEQKLFIYDINAKEQIAVEERTRKQANSRLWFRMRTGRVTASKFKSACVTDPLKPSHSLIMSICHPELMKFTSEATKWGCNHEAAAKEVYFQVQDNRHQGLKIEESGVFISTEYGFLGVTPDGLVSCKCCGNGIIEIKVQAQLFCTSRSYCDFIVWTEKSIYVERLTADERFMKANLLKVKEFVTRCLIPEILSNWYSKSMDKCKGGKISRAD